MSGLFIASALLTLAGLASPLVFRLRGPVRWWRAHWSTSFTAADSAGRPPMTLNPRGGQASD